MKKILIISLILFISELTYGEVYKWVDERGVVHFTDDMMQIPEKYRGGIEKMGVSEEGTKPQKESDLSSKRKEDTYRDSLGRGEEYWRSRVEEQRNRIKTLQDRIENLRMKYNELTERFNDSKSSTERAALRSERDQVRAEMEQNRIQLEEAKLILEKKIPEEAELYKAKPEWIK
ncbi:MAG: DUF4124 domain-containing protein [Thermodesulfobacteriota bacterium]